MSTWQRIHWFEGAAGRETDFVRLRTAPTLVPLFSFKQGASTAQLPLHILGICFQYETPRLCGNFSDVVVVRVTYATGVFNTLCWSFVATKRNTITESLLHINTNCDY